MRKREPEDFGALGEVVYEALSRPVAFYRVFFKLTGSVNAALMASQAHFWSGTDVARNRGGWFYKTQKEWEEETCLTRREQDNARRTLRATGFWYEELRGIPATMHYRLDYPALANCILYNPTEFVRNVQTESTEQPNPIEPNVQPLKPETTQENTPETTTGEPVRPFLHKPEKREKAKKAKPKFPTAGYNRARRESASFTPNKAAEELYTRIRTEVQERGDRSPGGMTGPMQERWNELYETNGPDLLTKSFWLWWNREGESLPEDFSRPIAMFLKDATGCIAEAAAKRKKPKSDYVSAFDNIPPMPKRVVNHSWEKKYVSKK